MKKIGNVLLATISFVFILLFSWIVINGIFLGQDVIFKYKPIFLILLTIIDIVVLVLIYKKIIPILIRYKYLPIILFFIFGLIAIVVSYKLRLNPSWDMGRVFNMAVNYVEFGTVNDTYLYEYQNNIAITLIYICVLKIFSMFNFTDYITAITFFNAMIVTLTVICLYYIVKKIYGKEKAIMTLVICILTTPFYLHAAIYYTDTMSMLFCIIALLMYANIRSEEIKCKKIIYQILLGIIIVLCFEIKLTAIFIIIAIIVAEVLNNNFKNLIKNFKFVIPSALIFIMFYTVCVNCIVVSNKDALNSYKMPIEHWLWIGSVGNGGFNQEAYEYTYSFPTYEEKKKADIEKFKEVLKNYNIYSFTQHINEKLKYTWSDGTYLAPEKLRRFPLEKTRVYEYVASDGQKTEYYKYFPQVMHFTMLILMLVNGLYLIKNKIYNKDDMFLLIAILGLAVFLMIWENRSRYILTLVPIMIIMEVNGIDILSKLKKKSFK